MTEFVKGNLNGLRVEQTYRGLKKISFSFSFVLVLA